MKPINIHEAKTQFSKLIEKVSDGEEVIIARSGEPIARLVPFSPAKRKLGAPGSMKGRIVAADGFDLPIDDVFDDLSDSAGA